MQYVLVENKSTVILGPIFWKQRFIQSELDDMEVTFTVSPTEPNEYVKINDTLEIFPVVDVVTPSYDSQYEQPSGPFWTFENNQAVATYGVAPKNIDAIKNELKAKAARLRYGKESSGIKLTIQNTEVSTATDRDSRNIYTQKLVVMGDTDTVLWKFKEAWLTLTKAELTELVSSVNNHVQAQYDWEANIVGQVDAATTVEELKAIVFVEQPEGAA